MESFEIIYNGQPVRVEEEWIGDANRFTVFLDPLLQLEMSLAHPEPKWMIVGQGHSEHVACEVGELIDKRVR